MTSCTVDTTNRRIYIGNNFNTAISSTGASMKVVFGLMTNPAASTTASTLTLTSYADSGFTYSMD